MKNTLLPLALAALFSAFAAFADVDSRNAGGTDNPQRRDATPEQVKTNAEQTIRTKAAVEPQNAGGSKVTPATATNTRPASGLRTAADIDARNAGGSAGTVRTTTTTTSQAMSDRVPVDTTSQNSTRYADSDSHPSGLAVFSIILLVALVAGLGVRTYRVRHQTL